MANTYSGAFQFDATGALVTTAGNISLGNVSINVSTLALEVGGNVSQIANNTLNISQQATQSNITLSNIAAAIASQNAILGNGTQNTTVVNQRINITSAPITVAANATSTNSASNITGSNVVVSSTVDSWVLITTNGTNANATVNSSPSIFVGAGTYTAPITANNLSNGSFKVAAIAANSSNAIGYVQVMNWG